MVWQQGRAVSQSRFLTICYRKYGLVADESPDFAKKADWWHTMGQKFAMVVWRASDKISWRFPDSMIGR
jgi:hypothetical protein